MLTLWLGVFRSKNIWLTDILSTQYKARCVTHLTVDQITESGKPYWKVRLSTIDLLVETTLDQLIFIFIISITFFTKQANLTTRSNVLNLPFQIEFRDWIIGMLVWTSECLFSLKKLNQNQTVFETSWQNCKKFLVPTEKTKSS